MCLLPVISNRFTVCNNGEELCSTETVLLITLAGEV